MPWRLAMTTAISMSRSGRMPPKSRSISPGPRDASSPRCAQKRRSNSSSSSLPSSRSNSSWRPSPSLRNAPRTVSASSPSASQNALNDSKMFVVRTPPKSTSRPLRGAKSHRLGALGELDDAVAEPLEVRVVRRAGHRALVVALHEDDRLPQRERPVPLHVAHRAPGLLLVTRDQLRADREALGARDAAELEHPQRRVVAVDPELAQVAEVRQRVADRRHLPVEDGDEPGGRPAREHRVAEPEV